MTKSGFRHFEITIECSCDVRVLPRTQILTCEHGMRRRRFSGGYTSSRRPRRGVASFDLKLFINILKSFTANYKQSAGESATVKQSASKLQVSTH